MPVSTLRSWVIGILWAVLIPGLNQFLFFRFPSITVSGVSSHLLHPRRDRLTKILSQIVAQLLSFPVGRLWAHVVPRVKVFGISLNPGPFTVKEHVLITVMATVGYQSAYAVSSIDRECGYNILMGIF